jgi:hypothetical protein
MTANHARFKVKTVTVSRRRESRTTAAHEHDGWQLVSRSQGRLRTRLTFRRQQPRRWKRRGLLSGGLVLLLLALVTTEATDVSNISDGVRAFLPEHRDPVDGDRDGIRDSLETTGWLTRSGETYMTDPDNVDTDGDGLTDGDEAGSILADAEGANVFAGFSNPNLPDSDGDDLGDADEADLGLNPLSRDTDGDLIEDGPEVALVGSAPDLADTDGDGFDDGYEDANRESQGLDPLWADEKVTKWTYATDFAKGAVLGDFNREDSLAWLAGNLSSGGSSTIPVVGWLVGGVADVRDTVGSAIRADWVGTSFSAAGIVPYAGDAIAIPGKAAKFVARNPDLAAAVATAIVATSKIPEAVKVQTAKQVWNDWDDLKAIGASDKALLQLQMGRTNLDDVAAAVSRSTPVSGPSTRFLEWREGESYLADLYQANVSGVTKQVRASTGGCTDVCTGTVRIFDVFADGVAHESKVGRVTYSAFARNQIQKDAWLVRNGDIEGAHWHFFASARSNTIGADPRLLDLLDEFDIPYTIHVPATT